MNINQILLLWTFSVIALSSVQSQTIQANIQVNADSEGDHEETFIAINPLDEDNLVAGSFYTTGSGVTEEKHLAYYYSFDGGFTWGEGFLPLGGQYANIADPVIAFDAQGVAYYVHICHDGVVGCTGPWSDNGLFVNRSTNGGLTWLGSPWVVSQNGDGTNPACTQLYSEDKPWIACDASSTSPYESNVYISWARFYTGTNRQIMFSRRTPNPLESSFEPPIALNVINTSSMAPTVAVGPGGIVYVAWFEANAIKVSMSTNGGLSFSPLPDAATGIVSLERVSERRANSFPAMAVDNSDGPWRGYVHITWADLVNGNPDIYWAYGIPVPEGIEWQGEAVIHAPSTADQWFPAITVDPNGIAHIAYYDKRNHGAGDWTDVYVAAVAPIEIWEAQVNTQSFNVTYDRNFFLGDYIGIASSRTRIFPFWTDTRNAGGQSEPREDVYVGIVDQRSVNVTLDQRIGAQSSGSVGRWEHNQFVDYPAGGPAISMVFGSREILKGSQDVASVGTNEEKYNRWNDFTNVKNHQEFTIDGIPTYVSNFKQTVGGAIIQNNLLDAPDPSAGNIQFRDPWVIDFDDPPYGFRNRGQDEAVFHTVPSPFNPTTEPGHPGSDYNGVFLEQFSSGTHYRAKALSTPLLGNTWNFLSWEYDPIDAAVEPELQNPREAAVIFLRDGATISAKYKGHLISSTDAVTSRPTTRRMVRDIEGRYHLVYESAGSIWYTKSTNGGQTWSPETVVYEQDEEYTFRDPSITVQQYPHTIAVTCEIVYTLTSEKAVLLALIDPATGELLPAEEDVGYVDSTSPTLPVVGSAVDTDVPGTNYLLVVWYDPNGPAMKGRIRRGSDGTWFGEGILKSVAVSRISVAPICAAIGDKWHIVWKEGENLYYSQIDVGEGSPSLETPNFVLADGSATEIELDNPSVVRLFKSQGNPAVAWEEYNSELARRRIKFRERLNADPPTWTNPTVWTGPLNSFFLQSKPEWSA